MSWQENAACLDADPFLFDVRDFHTGSEEPAINAAGRRYCATCPMTRACGEMADDARLQGLYGGIYRRHQHGRYVWRVVVDGAREPQLSDRRSGVNVGWAS